MPDQLPQSAEIDWPTETAPKASAAQAQLPQSAEVDLEGKGSKQTGMMKNIGAGLTEGGAGLLDIASDPFGNLIGRPLATAATYGYNAIAPYLGQKPITTKERHDILSVPDQPGSQIMSAGLKAINAPRPEDVVPGTTAERLARSGAAGLVGAGAFGSPMVIPATIAGSEAAHQFPEHEEASGYLGSMVPGAISGAIGKAAAGKPIPVENARLAKFALDQGIPLGQHQVQTGMMPKFIYDQTAKVPLSGADQFASTQRASWIKALSKQFGENAEAITPEVIDNAYNKIGKKFDTVANNTPAPLEHDSPTFGRLQSVVDNAKMELPKDQASIIERQALNILHVAGNNEGELGGNVYQNLTQFNSPLSRLSKNIDPGIRHYANELRDVLNQHLQDNATPENLSILKEARRQYKALKTVEPLTLRADTISGGSPSTGDINPSALLAEVKKNYPGSNLTRGKVGEMADLAKIGQLFLKPPPDSTTATRTRINQAIGSMLPLAGGAAGALTGVAGAAAGTAATLGANRLINAYLRNQSGANRMIQRGLGQEPLSMPSALTSGAISSAIRPQDEETEPLERASGGRAQSGHEHLVNRLMSLADKAKRTEAMNTKTLLNAPDAHIVKALHVANQAI